MRAARNAMLVAAQEQCGIDLVIGTKAMKCRRTKNALNGEREPVWANFLRRARSLANGSSEEITTSRLVSPPMET